MMVRELIAELLELDMDAEVSAVVVSDTHCDIDTSFELVFNSNHFSSSKPNLEIQIDLTGYIDEQ